MQDVRTKNWMHNKKLGNIQLKLIELKTKINVDS